MPKTLTIRIDNETYDTFAQLARAENRSTRMIKTYAIITVNL